MKFNHTKIIHGAVFLVALLLSACGGGGGGATAPAPTYTIGGTLTGLSGTGLVLQNNTGDNLAVSANGAFTFATNAANGSTYNVTALTQPAGQTCSVSTGAGTVSGNSVSNVAVVCSNNAYNVGGTVAGLTGSVVLQDNNGDNLTVAANGAFTFATKVAYTSPYSVTVLTQPSGKSCSVAGGTGTMGTASVANVAITCATNTYTVGGNVSLLNGSMVLQDNGADNKTVAVNGPFNFSTAVANGNPYNVSVLTQPLNQNCFVANGAGSVTANVSTVGISCASQMGGAMQGIPLNLAPTVSTLAGTADPAADGTGAAARFQQPAGVVSDGSNLYVAERGNNKIRKIVIATGVTSTLAGSGAAGAAEGAGTAASFNNPFGITTDGSNLYVADASNNKIRKIVIATGATSTLAGSGAAGAADATGTAATFSSPIGITIDSTNTNLYVADNFNNKIRQIVIATGVVSSFTGVASTTGAAGAADGAAASATFNYPQGIATDGVNLYVADTNNHKIRKILIATGATSSLTGAANTAGVGGAADGAATTATFLGPRGITSDGTNLYVADYGNNKIRVVAISGGATSSLTGAASTAGTVGFADGAGSAATFWQPFGITTFGGKLYVSDMPNSTVRSIAISTAAVTTLAGNANPAADGAGAAARFWSPQQVTNDGTNLYVADTANNIIRKIVIATGAVTTLAGSGKPGVADGTGPTAWFNGPTGITTDGLNLYVTEIYNNKIRQIVIATGVVTTLAGSGTQGAADGAGTGATFAGPSGITTDGANLYVAEYANNKIRKIVIATGQVTSLTGTANTAMTAGAADGAATAATFFYPNGIATDGVNLYVADTNNNKIRKIVIATGVVSSLTGAANATAGPGFADGASTAATFNVPYGITTDGANLYVADSGNRKIRKIAIANGATSSLTGAASTAGTFGFADGTGSAATFNAPYGITSDGASLYVTDVNGNTIRKIQ